MRLKYGEWLLALVLAVGIVLLLAEVSPTAVNALLILVLVGMVLSRWSQIAPYVNLASRVGG